MNVIVLISKSVFFFAIQHSFGCFKLHFKLPEKCRKILEVVKAFLNGKSHLLKLIGDYDKR